MTRTLTFTYKGFFLAFHFDADKKVCCNCFVGMIWRAAAY